MKKRILIAAVTVIALGALAMPLLAQEPEGAPPAATHSANAAAVNAPASGPAGNAASVQTAPSSSPFSMWVIVPLIAVLFLMMWWSSRSRRKQEAKHKEMLANLKKGDKVTSIGGIRGTVIETRDDEVLVKVDETNNIRMRFARWAIRNVGEEARGEPAQQPPQEQK